ncbi:MAG: M3 family oligoendopeptidase [Chitinophagaceae bacterium]
MNQPSAQIEKLKRSFIPEDFQVTVWEKLQPFFEQLMQKPLNSPEDLHQWLRDLSELEAVISEDASWRQIRMTCDTTSKELEEAFTYFCMEIQPRIQPYGDILNRKLLASPYIRDLDSRLYFTYLRNVERQVKLFCEKNIPLTAELSVMQQQYGTISSKMTIEVEGKEFTLQQAAKFLENSNRSLREEVFGKITRRRLQDRKTLDELFSQLVSIRDQMGRNAGFDNYRDFKFEELGRYDYSRLDCEQFQESVRIHLLPLVEKILLHKKNRLGLDTLRPWDTEAEPPNIAPLSPFKTEDELVEKTIRCLSSLRPFFGACIRVMKDLHHLDLESRKGKAPGGYNCPLAESGVPFIFMNAAGQMRDVITMVHEGGHAIHSFLTHDLELNAFKEYPMEMAEVASMSMELMSMDYWDLFFEDPKDLKRAKIQQLERVLTIFPWIAMIDKFQHWIYTHPQHGVEQRTAVWMEISQQYSTGVIDWTGWESCQQTSWQKQLHLFEVPFYYIEYGIAQLGAIAMWKQFRENKELAMDNYMNALSLGYTRPLKELYAAAGIPFDFSSAYIRELSDFVAREMDLLLDHPTAE